MKKMALIILFVCQIHIGSTYANQTPIPYPSDSRIRMVTYQENNVVPIYGRTFTSTQVVFSKDEYVLDIEGGDTSGWIVTNHKNLPNMVFIKPTMLNSDSNMTIVTNKHDYYFHVMSNKTLNVRDEDQTYSIKFIYPEDERNRLRASFSRNRRIKNTNLNRSRSPKSYNWDYTFSGNRQIMPVHVFDDGTFTYFELQKNQAVPAFFAVDDRYGKESVVNTRRQGNYIVVQRLAPQFTLRNGKSAVASIFNKKEIAKIKQRSRRWA